MFYESHLEFQFQISALCPPLFELCYFTSLDCIIFTDRTQSRAVKQVGQLLRWLLKLWRKYELNSNIGTYSSIINSSSTTLYTYIIFSSIRIYLVESHAVGQIYSSFPITSLSFETFGHRVLA